MNSPCFFLCLCPSLVGPVPVHAHVPKAAILAAFAWETKVFVLLVIWAVPNPSAKKLLLLDHTNSRSIWQHPALPSHNSTRTEPPFFDVACNRQASSSDCRPAPCLLTCCNVPPARSVCPTLCEEGRCWSDVNLIRAWHYVFFLNSLSRLMYKLETKSVLARVRLLRCLRCAAVSSFLYEILYL